MTLNWIRYDNGNWCDFLGLDLSNSHFANLGGVYVIWCRKNMSAVPTVVRVGQGDIKDRITAHRNDPDILAYKNHGLYVTWASVSPTFRDGVERFLADSLRPEIGDAFPSVMPTRVNLPW